MSPIGSLHPERELHERALDAVLGLVRALGTSLDVRTVARLSLLTVAGHLLVRRAAFYVADDESGYRLCEVVGLRRSILEQETSFVSESLDACRQAGADVVALDEDWDLPAAIREHFRRATFLQDGDRTVGLLLLGEELKPASLLDDDVPLLETMGLVIGTTLQRAIVYQQMVDTKLKLEEAERIRKGIIDHVSHEFNTPLMVVENTVDLARTASAEEQLELFGMHDEAVGRLKYLVKSILQFGEYSRTNSPSLNAMRHDDFVFGVLLPILGQHRLEDARLVLGHQPCRRAHVDVDPSRLQIAIDVLLSNATQFSRPETPWVVLHSYVTSRGWYEEHSNIGRVDRYRARLDGSGLEEVEPLFGAPLPGCQEILDPVAVIEVIDAGIGIPESELERVFEPFTQASNSPTQGIRGAGVGLTSCQRMVEDQRGALIVRSREDVGSIFAILLPAEIRPDEPDDDAGC